MSGTSARGASKARGRGRGRGSRGSGLNSSGLVGKDVAAVVVQEAKTETSLKQSESTHGATKQEKELRTVMPVRTNALQLDANGRIIANIPPAKRFPISTDQSLMNAFHQDIEASALTSKTSQSVMGEAPRKVIDNLKLTPIERMSGMDTFWSCLWKNKPPAQSEMAPTKPFYDMALDAMQADVDAFSRVLGTLSTKPSSDLTTSLKKVERGGGEELFWRARDTSETLYSDTEDEKDGRDLRFAPPVRLLRHVRNAFIRNEQKNYTIGRALQVMTHDTRKEAVLEQVEACLKESASSEKKRFARRRWREYCEAAGYAEHELATRSPAFNSSQETIDSDFSRLILSALARAFPERLRSSQLAHFAVNAHGNLTIEAADAALKWVVEDKRILGADDLKKLSLKPFAVVGPTHQYLYIGNLLQISGRPCGKSFSSTNDFKYWVLSMQDGFTPLKLVSGATNKPHLRTLRNAVAVRNSRKHVEGTPAADNVWSIGASTVAQSGGGDERADSDADKSETEDFETQGRVAVQMAKQPESLRFMESGYGPEHTCMRLGRGVGRLRNAFDQNRRRNLLLELTKDDVDDPVPMLYESSEDENQTYVDAQSQYRHHYRENKKKEAVTGSAEKEREWPSHTLDMVRSRLSAESKAADKAVEEAGTTGKKRRKAASQAAEAFERSRKLAEELGIRDEAWRNLNLKPRVRRIETRFDRDATSLRPLGFIAKGRTVASRPLQMLAVDETEVIRRFGLNKLFQQNMPGIDAKMTHRRHFAAIINEKTKQVRLVPIGRVRLVVSDTPEGALENLSERLYWEQARSGEMEQRLVRKALRYKTMYDNNCMVSKEDLDRYQKLREKANEYQGHKTVRDLKLNIVSANVRINLDSLAEPVFEYAYADDDDVDSDCVTESEDDASTMCYDGITGTADGQASPATVATSHGATDASIDVFADKKKTEGVKVGLEEAKGESRLARRRAEMRDAGSGFRRIKAHMFVDWNGVGKAFRERLVERHRTALPQVFFGNVRHYRKFYKTIRNDAADRILYENAWTAAASRRAAASQREVAIGNDE